MDDTLLGAEAFVTIPSQREVMAAITTFDDVLDEMHRFTTAQREAFMKAVKNIDIGVCETLVVALVDQAYNRVINRRTRG